MFVVPGGFFLVVVVFVLALLLIKVLWSWTVPDLFPKAVQQGLVSGWISWWTSLKLAIFVAFVATVTGIRGRGHTHKKEEPVAETSRRR